MSKLSWCVKLKDNDTNFSGSVNAENIVRVCPHIPAGEIERVTAVIPHKMTDEERLFMNGYQTWTYSPEYGKNDRQRGLSHLPKALVDKYSFDRYGDYHFVKYPGTKGFFHGFSYCYFRRGEKFSLIASLSERQGYTIFRYDSKKGLLYIERDCSGVYHNGGCFPAFELYFGNGSENKVFDEWFSAMGIKPLTEKQIAGYSSWYNRYEDITYDSIISDLEGCKKVMKPGDLFQIDDGWEPYVGDWLIPDKEKFPVDMKNVTDTIHSSGFKAGLWLAPFVCEEKSDIFKNHPDWLFKVQGKPYKCGGNWSGFYALDIDNKEVRDYLKEVFDRVLNTWGFDLVKLDFLYGAAPFGTREESRGGRMIRAMELLREWCGDKLILGCGVPVMPAFCLVDYCRVSCDVGLDWDDKWFMRLMHRERVSTKQAIENTIFRRQLNRRAYLSDPDVFFLRDYNISLTKQQKEKLATVNALMGGVLLTSDDPSHYTAEKCEFYIHLLMLRYATDIKVNTDNGIRISYNLGGTKNTIQI